MIDIDGEAHPYLSLIVWSTVATPPGLPSDGHAGGAFQGRPSYRRADYRAPVRGPHAARLRGSAGTGIRGLHGTARICRIVIRPTLGNSDLW